MQSHGERTGHVRITKMRNLSQLVNDDEEIATERFAGCVSLCQVGKKSKCSLRIRAVDVETKGTRKKLAETNLVLVLRFYFVALSFEAVDLLGELDVEDALTEESNGGRFGGLTYGASNEGLEFWLCEGPFRLLHRQAFPLDGDGIDNRGSRCSVRLTERGTGPFLVSESGMRNGGED